MRNDGNIPVLMVQGKTLPEVWERSLLELWEKGPEIKTQYDKEGDPPSKDCMMVMVVEEPLSEPRIHRAFPGGLENLEIYRQEFLDGIHDAWVDITGPTKWKYTYHQRFFSYEVEGRVIDQINDYLIPAIAEVPYSRRVQAVTWQVWLDPKVSDPPCLQRIWVRMPQNKRGEYVLNIHTFWRSRDAFKAAFMNMFVVAELQKMIAERVAAILQKPVVVGEMVDVSDNYHIYGKDFQDPNLAMSFQGFLKMHEARTLEERTWTMEFAEPIFEETREKLKKDRGT